MDLIAVCTIDNQVFSYKSYYQIVIVGRLQSTDFRGKNFIA